MSREIIKQENIPFGICHCGCGMPAPIAKKNSTRDKMVKGQPMTFIRGHAMGKFEAYRKVVDYKDLQCRRRYKAEAKIRHKMYVGEYLQTHPCTDCGESDPMVLDFDHRNPEEKHKTISQIMAVGLGIHILEKEINKCDVRCANCHRRRHYIEQHPPTNEEHKCTCGEPLEYYQYACFNCWKEVSEELVSD